MANFSTIHIFGFGNSQFISGSVNFQTASAALTNVNPIVTAVKSAKPADSDAGDALHAIQIFSLDDVRYLPLTGASYQLTGSAVDAFSGSINSLVTEFHAVV